MSNAIGAPRGCGTRQKGGIYAELGLAVGGTPIEAFLHDPPHELDASAISKRGTNPIERGGTTHLLDWIGAEHYPNVGDFIEEVRRLGLSRRLPRSKSVLEKLTPGSRILTVHPRAIVANQHKGLRPPNKRAGCRIPYLCPSGVEEHRTASDRPCLWATYEAIEGGEEVDPAVIGLLAHGADFGFTGEDAYRVVRRKMPAFSYMAMMSPEGFDPEWSAGIFGSFPISRLVVVNGGNADEAMGTIRESGTSLPVAAVDA